MFTGIPVAGPNTRNSFPVRHTTDAYNDGIRVMNWSTSKGGHKIIRFQRVYLTQRPEIPCMVLGVQPPRNRWNSNLPMSRNRNYGFYVLCSFTHLIPRPEAVPDENPVLHEQSFGPYHGAIPPSTVFRSMNSCYQLIDLTTLFTSIG